MTRTFLLLLAVAVAGTPAAARAQDVVPVVSARSPATALSPDQVADIFLGKASRFPDGRVAVPIDLPEESAARERFYAHFAGKSPAQLKAHWSKAIFTGRGQPPRQASNASDAKRLVAENPNAIGYLEPAQVDASVRVVGKPN